MTWFKQALLVEDEPHLAQTLKIALRKLGIPSVHSSTIRAAKEQLKDPKSCDFVLLDRHLPDGDGIELCRELRKQSYPGLILMLTAAGDLEQRVEGLDAGADDYLPKPFSWVELEARIRALSRRSRTQDGPANSTALKPMVWNRDEARLRIFGPNGWEELTPLEYKLASHLIEANGNIVSREELLKTVWGFSLLPKTRTVDHFLGRLRKRFEVNPEEPKHFLTIRGAGYRFER